MPADSTGPATDLIEYTSFGSAISLTAVKGEPARLLRAVTGDGSVSVKMAGSGNTARTITLNAGDFEVGQFTSIESVTTITRIRVGW